MNAVEEYTTSTFSSEVKMDRIGSSEMLITTYKTTQRYNTEAHNPKEVHI